MLWNAFKKSFNRSPACARLENSPNLESLEDRNCPAPFSVIGATGSPGTVLSVRVFNEAGTQVDAVQPFANTTSLRVATGDFDGDGIADEVAVLGRRTGIDFRAEIVTYDMDTSTGALSETGRFFAFDAGILGNGYIATGDFDGDGDDDIAVAQIGGGRTTVTLQTRISQGDGTFQTGGSSQIDFGSISAPRIGAGDTDNDGADNIVLAARTPSGADVRVFDANNSTLTPSQLGQFTWNFGVRGYARGAFVAVGEFNPKLAGEEIVLGSNVGGAGRVDVVNFADTSSDPVFDASSDRFQPFGSSYNAAVRVSVGTQYDDALGALVPVILAGQDRFQDGQAVFAQRNYALNTNPQDPAPAFTVGTPFTALTDSDGAAPPVGSDPTLGPFVSFANTTLVFGRGGLTARDSSDLPMDDPTSSSNIIDGTNSDKYFVISNADVAQPSGTTFNDPSTNHLVVLLDLNADTTGVLDGLIVNLYYATGATGSPLQIVHFIDATATGLVIQVSAGATQTIDNTATPQDGTVYGIFSGNGGNPDSLFSTGSLTNPSGFWVLEAYNTSGSGSITLNSWAMAWDVSSTA